MIQTVKGSFKELIAFRLPPGTDVMEGIKQGCEENNIKNGFIISAIGSLNGAVFLNPVPIAQMKLGYGYGEPIVLRGPIELVSAVGMICHNGEETLLHIHCCLSDQHGNGYGGHMTEGNKVLITTDVMIGVVDGIDMIRKMDEEAGIPIFHPEQR